MEEIAKHFDGDQAVVAGGAATEKALRLANEMGMDGTVTQVRELNEKNDGTVYHREEVGKVA